MTRTEVHPVRSSLSNCSSIRKRFPIGLLLACIALLPSCGEQRKPPAPTNSVSTEQASAVTPEAEQQIIKFCSLCHAMPDPKSFPKEAWYQEVKRGFDFYHISKRSDGVPPNVQVTVEYFRSRAPRKLEFSPETMSSTTTGSPASPAKIRFVLDAAAKPVYSNRIKPPVTSFIKRVDGLGQTPHLILSDMADGGIHLWKPIEPSAVLSTIGTVSHPAGLCVCDLDENGTRDLIVTDLGSFSPADHDRGRVVWLPDALGEAARREQVVLTEGLGRVADVQAADLDGDGDLDLAVAEFGWLKTGRVLWLKNIGTKAEPKFESHVLDARHGAIHVPIVDLDNDGRPDVVAVMSQEHETVEVHLNRGDGSFEKTLVYACGDPSFGSSGIQVIDFDGDGDFDFLHTNGDMFDSYLAKPYHGVRWLENKGAFPFEAHELGSLPGVHRALAADMDRDGDLDIVACSMWPKSLRDDSVKRGFSSIIWLEQTKFGVFQRHTIETARCIHAAMDLTDLDNDGDLDIVTGAFQERDDLSAVGATIWKNEPQQ